MITTPTIRRKRAAPANVREVAVGRMQHGPWPATIPAGTAIALSSGEMFETRHAVRWGPGESDPRMVAVWPRGRRRLIRVAVACACAVAAALALLLL